MWPKCHKTSFGFVNGKCKWGLGLVQRPNENEDLGHLGLDDTWKRYSSHINSQSLRVVGGGFCFFFPLLLLLCGYCLNMEYQN